MEIIGIIAEYNPFHNGHIYHIDEIKKKYPDSSIILVLNGYFLERGEVSVLTKEAKIKIALDYGVDLVMELPFVYGSQAADIFATEAIRILNNLNATRIIFGSESNDITKLKKLADMQYDPFYQEQVRNFLDDGLNYPTALAKALNVKESFFKPNDILGISYLKAIRLLKSNIIPETIKRTNNYHDIESNDNIISASNIRNKIKNNEDIGNYLPEISKENIIAINEDLLFKLIKHQILTDNNLEQYVDVDEGIDNRLKKEIINCNSLDDFMKKIKTKRYTYNKIMRMIMHIILGFTKEDNYRVEHNYMKVLGFNKRGKEYLHGIKICHNFRNTLVYQYELKASLIYQMITGVNTYKFDLESKPIVKN